MEVRVRERLIGALVLVGIVVLLVPAILTGGADRRAADRPEGATQSVVVPIGDAAPPPESDELVPEAEVPRAEPDAPEVTVLPPTSAAEPPPVVEIQPEPAPPAVDADVPARPPQPSAMPGESTAWAVQLGAFSSREKADRLVAELRARGYAAFLLEYRASGQVLHRVRVGPEQDRARAVAVAERLRKDGFQPVVAPHP